MTKDSVYMTIFSVDYIIRIVFAGILDKINLFRSKISIEKA